MDRRSFLKSVSLGLVGGLEGCTQKTYYNIEDVEQALATSRPVETKPKPLERKVVITPSYSARFHNCKQLSDCIISPKNVREIYGGDIEYVDFSKLEIDGGDMAREVPFDLASFFSSKILNRPRIKDWNKFEKLVNETALQIGYELKKIESMKAKRAIKAVVEIVSHRLTPFLVDDDAEFVKKYGKELPIERYFELGMGDCDKYRDSVIGVFSLFKQQNPNLRNVYVSNSRLGGRVIPHAWNSIVVLEKDKIKLSHIDVCRYDEGLGLEATDYHIDRKNFKKPFFEWMDVYKKR